jgi:N-acyl-phosphatidylethanolamine-hydrolysing phospholipase D
MRFDLVTETTLPGYSLTSLLFDMPQLGHATCYLQLNGKYFLTDPIWSDRASPFTNFGPMRYVPPPAPLEDLPIDYVLLSHTHYDHYDVATARRIGNRATWIVPKGVKAILKSIGITNTIELDWWQSHSLPIESSIEKEAIEIVFTPTQHWSSRSLFDRGTSLWGSYAVLAPTSRFFFTGDTAYCSVFKDIGETYGPFDLAAIPIGAYKPRQFMRDVHCDPAEAIQIHKDLNAKRSVGIHWGTFELSEEEFVEPALELGRVRAGDSTRPVDFFTMAHGETLPMGESSANDFSVLYPHLLTEYIANYEEEEAPEESPEPTVTQSDEKGPAQKLKRVTGALRDTQAQVMWTAQRQKDIVA